MDRNLSVDPVLMGKLRKLLSKNNVGVVGEEIAKIRGKITTEEHLNLLSRITDFVGFDGNGFGESLTQFFEYSSMHEQVDLGIDKIFDPTLMDNREISKLLRNIDSLHKNISQLMANDYVQKFTDLSSQDWKKGLIDKGLSIPEQDNKDEFNFLEFYYDSSVELSRTVQAYGTNPLEGVSNFLQAILKFPKYNLNAQKRLLDKLGAKKQELMEGFKINEESLEDSLTIEDQIERINSLKAWSQYAQEIVDNYVQSYLVIAKAGIFPFLVEDITSGKSEEEAMNPLLESLWKLVSKEDEEVNASKRLVDKIRDKFMDRFRGNTNSFEHTLEYLVDKDVELAEIRDLLNAAPNERVKEFYSILQAHPEYLQFSQIAKRINVQPKAYKNFLLEHAGIEINAGGKTTAFEFVNSLANDLHQNPVAKILIESDINWIPVAEQIYALAQAAPNTIPLIKLYITHANSLGSYKDEDIGSYITTSRTERRKISEILARIPEEYVEPLTREGPFNISRFTRKSPQKTVDDTNQKKALTPSPKTKGYNINQILDMDGINQEEVRDADVYLQLRDIKGLWEGVDVSIPERVNRLSRYIIAEVEADSPHFPKVFGNPRLRADYLLLFDGKPKPLDELLQGIRTNDPLYNNLAHQKLTAKG